jgi:hypothetical protein
MESPLKTQNMMDYFKSHLSKDDYDFVIEVMTTPLEEFIKAAKDEWDRDDKKYWENKEFLKTFSREYLKNIHNSIPAEIIESLKKEIEAYDRKDRKSGKTNTGIITYP